MWLVKPKILSGPSKFADLFYFINYEINTKFYLYAEGKKHG